MNRFLASMIASGLFVGIGLLAIAQPGEEKGKGEKKGPPPFLLGKVLPPFVHEALDLSEVQEEKLRELEQEVREKLEKILTKDQLRKIRELKGKGPKGPPEGDGKKGTDGKKKKDKGPPDTGDKEQVRIDPAVSKIQWFATWKTGVEEAKRSGRPIFLVSAAPHCAGVSGTW